MEQTTRNVLYLYFKEARTEPKSILFPATFPLSTATPANKLPAVTGLVNKIKNVIVKNKNKNVGNKAGVGQSVDQQKKDLKETQDIQKQMKNITQAMPQMIDLPNK